MEVRVPDFGTFAEEGIGFIEEEDRIGVLGGSEDTFEVLFGFTDVLADALRQIDVVQRQRWFIGDDIASHCLAATRRAREQDVRPMAQSKLAAEAPVLANGVPLLGLLADFVELSQFIGWQDQIVPSVSGRDLACQITQMVVGLATGGGVQQCGERRFDLLDGGRRACQVGNQQRCVEQTSQRLGDAAFANASRPLKVEPQIPVPFPCLHRQARQCLLQLGADRQLGQGGCRLAPLTERRQTGVEGVFSQQLADDLSI